MGIFAKSLLAGIPLELPHKQEKTKGERMREKINKRIEDKKKQAIKKIEDEVEYLTSLCWRVCPACAGDLKKYWCFWLKCMTCRKTYYYNPEA